MQALYKIAEAHIGLMEWPGAKHNPEIVKMYEASGHGWVKDDETPWCAAFVGSCLAQAGMKGTGKLDARSYLKWGEEVALDDAEFGDIVVLWRGSRDSWKGHVGFYAGIDVNGNILLVGGNQGNAVSKAGFKRDRLLGVRRAKMPRTSIAESTTVQAIGGGAIGNAATAFTVIPQLSGTAQIIAIIGFMAIGAVLAYVYLERKRKWELGDR